MENKVKLSNIDYLMLLRAIDHIKRINDSILSIHDNYISTDITITDECESIVSHYHEWINQPLNLDDEEIEDVGAKLHDLVTQSSKILLHTAYSIPENYIKPDNPNYSKIKDFYSKFKDNLDEMAVMMSSEYAESSNLIRHQLSEKYPEHGSNN